MGYETKHKKTVEDIFSSNKGECFTAENIVSILKEQGYSVGVATVYRQLDALVKKGKVAKIPTQSGSFLYQFEDCNRCIHQHSSLMCISCGKVIHMDCNELSKLSSHIKSHHVFQLDLYKTVLYGKCSECSEESGTTDTEDCIH
jgi:Fur family ferric uptake transcriptional regulator